MAATAGPIRTADMDPQDVAELLKKKMMAAKLSRAQVNKLKPPSLAGKDQCKGEGSIYSQALLYQTKKVIDDRKANQDVYTSGVARSVYGEVELTNYGPCLVENYHNEISRREANKEVFTPDIYRTVYDKGETHHEFAKTLNESQRAEAIRQLGNKGAHSGDIFRNFYGGSTGAIPETVQSCATCPGCLEEKNVEKTRKQKAIQQEAYLRQNIERQQRYLEKQKEKETAKQETIVQHERYQKQVEEFNKNPRIAKLTNKTVTGI